MPVSLVDTHRMVGVRWVVRDIWFCGFAKQVVNLIGQNRILSGRQK